MRELKLSQMVGQDEYDTPFDVDVYTEDEILFKANNYIFEAHIRSDEDVDYTVYNDNSFKEIDGGIIEAADETCCQIIDIIGFSYINDLCAKPLSDIQITLLNHDDYEEIIEKNNLN